MLLDGGLATTLQSQGLSPFTPVNEWLDLHPEAIALTHRAFALAGATAVLAGTFRLLPHLDPQWRRRGERAVDLARQSGVRVLLSIGPAGSVGEAWDGDPAPYRELAAALAPACDGVVLETFTSQGELLAALRAVREVHVGLLVASLCPAGEGLLVDGSEPAPAVDFLRRSGADFVGFNCGPGCVAAARRCLAAGVEVDWLKPNADDDELPDLVLQRVPHVGGCCGVGPEAIASLRRRRDAMGVSTLVGL